MSKVALVRCESYAYDQVRAAVQRGIDLVGGAAAFAQPQETILLKPNWIVAVNPEKCATTHPAVFQALCDIFAQTGCQLTYGDSPGHNTPEEAARLTGFLEVAQEYDLSLADFENGQEVITESGFERRTFTVANGALACDGMISLPKLKTQGFLKLTGAVKNQFGCIPGQRKRDYHRELQKPADFARMLIDLNLFLRPRLYVMDGIVGMDGNGPMNGDPRQMNVLLFSTDPIALDATVCRIIDLPPEYSYTVTLGRQAGHGTYLESEIELVGDPLESFLDKGFNVNRDPISNVRIGKGVFSFLNDAVVPKPVIIADKCQQCGVCIQMCPIVPKVVDWPDGDKSQAPTYDYSRCIRCFCCQETCPTGAIEIKEPVLQRILG